jgi:hypothetical protein
MVQRDADLLAAVLEAEDLLDAVERVECDGAVDPCLHHRAHPVGRERSEGRAVVGREADDLAPSDAGPPREQVRHTAAARVTVTRVGGAHVARVDGEGREAVLEHHHVVRIGRDLGQPARPGRAERTLIRGGQERTPLPVRGDGNPLGKDRVVAQLGPANPGRQVALVGDVASHARSNRAVGLVEVDQLAPVRQPGRRFVHACPISPSRRRRLEPGATDQVTRTSENPSVAGLRYPGRTNPGRENGVD